MSALRQTGTGLKLSKYKKHQTKPLSLIKRVQVNTVKTDYKGLQHTLSRPVCGNLKIPIVSNFRSTECLCVVWAPAISAAIACRGETLAGHGAWGLLCTGPSWSVGVPGCAEACALPPLVTPRMCMISNPVIHSDVDVPYVCGCAGQVHALTHVFALCAALVLLLGLPQTGLQKSLDLLLT